MKAAEAIKEGNFSREYWESLVQCAQAIDTRSCFWLCEIALRHPKSASLLKKIAIDWYEKDALSGDEKSVDILRNCAVMLRDQELLDRFDPIHKNAEWILSSDDYYCNEVLFGLPAREKRVIRIPCGPVIYRKA